MIDNKQFYINGEWINPAVENPFEVINPATEKAVGVISMGTNADVDKAVAAAVTAFPSWSITSVEERIALMKRFIDLYEQHAEEMAQLMMLEMGSPIRFSRNDQTPTGPGLFQSTIDAMEAHDFERPSMRGGSLLHDEAVGVCGLITPWNWPINQVAAKVAPALGAGCTMILKPSEQSPLSAILFAEILHEAGCPKGVFNLVNGDGLGVGSAISNHPDIDMVSFTGSTRAGTEITKASASTIKRVALELGGKSPNICFADADLESAIKYSVDNIMSNSGQT
ncbi:MAG: aldehyde dehydrogenase (NAD+), partial [Cocleimonas sp.]